jgi:hypothetical protein
LQRHCAPRGSPGARACAPGTARDPATAQRLLLEDPPHTPLSQPPVRSH